MLSNEKFQELVNRARDFNAYTVSYAQSVLWGERDQETSIKDIALAVETARNSLKTLRSMGELEDILFNDAEYIKAEVEMSKAAHKLIDLHRIMQERYQLTDALSYVLLANICNRTKKNLFN